MSDGSPNNNFEDRLSRLERKVDRLERIIREQKKSDIKAQKQESKTPVQEQAEEEQKVRYEETAHPEKASSWEDQQNLLGQNWLNWLGIGLLLLGVMFLFKYSIDQGWLIPPVRSAFGVAIGCGLLAGGFAIEKENILRQILLGAESLRSILRGLPASSSIAFYPASWCGFLWWG
ncbi:MAG: DUF2339 domain-containing protein [Balneolaceae bacterium]|nr:DUF2339 domain-containing protein [Balneolaceae bacterium]